VAMFIYGTAFQHGVITPFNVPTKLSQIHFRYF
jgi:hypothetical protein